MEYQWHRLLSLERLFQVNRYWVNDYIHRLGLYKEQFRSTRQTNCLLANTKSRSSQTFPSLIKAHKCVPTKSHWLLSSFTYIDDKMEKACIQHDLWLWAWFTLIKVGKRIEIWVTSEEKVSSSICIHSHVPYIPLPPWFQEGPPHSVFKAYSFLFCLSRHLSSIH